MPVEVQRSPIGREGRSPVIAVTEDHNPARRSPARATFAAKAKAQGAKKSVARAQPKAVKKAKAA